jgi:hypothetical protein
MANMKRAKSRTRQTLGNASGRVSRKPVDLSAVREEIKNLVGNAATEMVQNGIEEANKGHYAAMKFLFELVGLYPAVEAAEQGEEEGSLANTLLSRLGVAVPEPATEVTKDSPVHPMAGSDAVE